MKALGNHLRIDQVLSSSLCPGVYLKAHHRPLGVGGDSALIKEAFHYLFLYTETLHRNFLRKVFVTRKKFIKTIMLFVPHFLVLKYFLLFSIWFSHKPIELQGTEWKIAHEA